MEFDSEENKVKVSVVIPCYNDGLYIHDAVDSIKQQTYREYEIIVVDDGSDDPKTKQALDELKQKDVQVFHKDNGGVSTARNFGISKAKGEYILALDSDDMFAECFLEEAVKILDTNHEVGVVTSYARYFGLEEGYVRKPTFKGVSDLLTNNYFDGSLLYRYQCWVDANGYDTQLEGVEDWDYLIRVAKKGWIFHVIPEPWFHYRITEKSLYQRTRYKKPQQMRRIVENHLELYCENVAECIHDRELIIRELEVELEKKEPGYKKLWNGRSVM